MPAGSIANNDAGCRAIAFVDWLLTAEAAMATAQITRSDDTASNKQAGAAVEWPLPQLWLRQQVMSDG